MPSTRLHSMQPRASLQRLKTAFSPSSTSLSTASVSSRSPLSASTRRSSRFSGLNFDFEFLNKSTISLPGNRSSRRVIRRKKSAVEMEQEEERFFFDDSLVSIVEPRPQVGPSLGTIDEVLNGRV